MLRVCVKFCCKLGKNFTETFQLLNQAYGEDCISRTQCYEWFKHSKEGRMSVGEDPSPGRPSTSTGDDHVKRVRVVIRGNRHLTVREVADEVGISTGSWHQILTEKLQMCRVSAKLVPRLLTDDQKENHVEISQELLASANGNENFLKKIITGDETWVYGYDVETKMQSSQWMGKGSPRPKKAWMSRSKINVVLVVFFDWESHCPSWICTTWSHGKQTVLPESFSEFEGCCAQEEAWIVGKPDLDVAPRQCAGSHVAPHLQLSGKTSDIH